MIPVIRTEKIKEFNKLLSQIDKRGLLCYVLAPTGMGKSSFLQSIKEHLKNDDSVVCVLQEIKQVATTNFFFNLMDGLEKETHPTKSKIKKFFSDHKKYLIPTARFIGTATNTRDIVDLATDAILPQDKSHLNTLIQDEFIKALTEFTEKFPDNKISILVDDIDSNLQKDLFIAMFNDLRKRLPKNTIILLASTKKEAESDHHISLDNFNHEEISKFMRQNFENVNENMIREIENKTAGLPESLFWLFETYQQDKQDISQLLIRLSREGFKNQIQEKFLKKLSEQENAIPILKVCSLITTIDRVTISSVLNIDDIKVIEIFRDFQNKGMLDLVNTITMPDGQIVDLFFLKKTYSKGITSIYGSQNELKNKIINYFADIIVDSDNAVIKTFTIQRILDLYLQPTGTAIPKLKKLFDIVNQDPDKKCSLWLNLYTYFMGLFEMKRVVDLTEFLPVLIQNLTNKIKADAYNKFLELVKFLYDKDLDFEKLMTDKELQSQRSKEILTKINDLEKVISQDSANLDFKTMQTFLDMVKFGVSQSPNLENILSEEGGFDALMESALDQTINMGVKQALENPEYMFKNEKEVKFLLAYTLGGQTLGTGMAKMASAYFDRAVKYHDLLTDDEKNEIDQILKEINNPTNFAEIEDELSYYIQYAKLLEITNDFSLKAEKKIEKLQEVTNKLKQWESHPIRRQTYDIAEKTLEETRQKIENA